MPPPKTTINLDPLGLFTDGPPPHWTVGKGKPYERPCQIAWQAAVQRDEVASKLRWHGNHSIAQPPLTLAGLLEACAPGNPCLSGACPICERAQQRLFVMACVSVVKQPHPLFGGVLNAISIIPDFGRVTQGELANFDAVEFHQKTREALKAAGITHYILGLDVSLNHNAGERDLAYWQFQWWGFFEEPDGLWRETLKAQINLSSLVSRPVKVITPDSLEAAAAYGLKSTFTRRISLVKANLDRDDRGPCRNTHDCPLRGEGWIELMLFLDRIGLERRLIGKGYKIPYRPLRSRAKPASKVV